jgi:hypothetical protein
MNMYLDDCLVRSRLDEVQAMAARWALVESLRPAAPPARRWLGAALVKLGCWLTGGGCRGGEPGRAAA